MLRVDSVDKVMALLKDYKPGPVDRKQQLRLAAAALRAAGPMRPPAIPRSELRPQGRRHSSDRDARAVRHHYDVSNEFFSLFLDDSMTYSCAIFSRGATTLEEAQWAKRELVCTKLGLQAGERLLDVGCGWGSFSVHAAKHHGARVVGLTLSEPQAERARQRARDEGVEDLVEIRVQDYRDITDGPFDAIASIGMVEHVGSAQVDAYAGVLHRLLKPGGQLLNHGIARLRHDDPEAGPFSERYVFPDAAPLHVSRILGAMEHAGFVTEHAEQFTDDYARTLEEWTRRFDSNLERAEQIAGSERARVWQLYLRGARNGFTSGFLGLYQVRFTRV